MKTSLLKQFFLAGTVLAGVSLTPDLRANTEVVIAGGNASSAILFDRATNVLNGGAITAYGLSSSTVRSYQGTISGQSGLGTVTLDYVLNGAVGGLQDIEAGNPQTTASGNNTLPPTLVDSSTTPGAVALDPSVLTGLPVYVVPYVLFRNNSANSSDSVGITNLTARQAVYLEGAGATIPASFFGGAGTNPVYFIGRNNQSAVRTETDLNIGFTGSLKTYYTNSAGGNVPILDTTSVDSNGNPDPGLSSGSVLYNTVLVVSNSIGNAAVKDAKAAGVLRLTYEGVPYSYSNVVTGSYPLWYYESYYYKNTGSGQPTAAQQTIINLLYGSVTNAAYTVSSLYTNNYIPEPALIVKRGFDGGPITLK